MEIDDRVGGTRERKKKAKRWVKEFNWFELSIPFD